MQIIDFEKKGNVVRFYLGEKTADWGWTNKDFRDHNGNQPEWLKPSDEYFGDDWDDYSYEDNAGRVYDEFIKDAQDVAFPFDDLVLEPAENYNGLEFCKDDMRNRKVPAIIVIPKEVVGDNCSTDFGFWICNGDERIKKFYFGDNEAVLKSYNR